MKSSLSRREFLKLTGMLSLSYAIPPSISNITSVEGQPGKENVLIVVFDAWSASNISLYGYSRKTTPNLEMLTEKAIIYHNHFAGGHFTPPGTASLLTGTSSWTHRVFKQNGIIDAAIVNRNIFNAFNAYHRLAYTHNLLADRILRQYISTIEAFTPWQSLYLESDPLTNTLFKNDQDTALLSWRRALKRLEEGHSYSLYLSQFYEQFKRKKVEHLILDFPRGLPNYTGAGLNFFTLEHGIDWLTNQIVESPQPFLGYYHFLPPHAPYNTRKQFYDKFADDNYCPPDKPVHLLGREISKNMLTSNLQWYDDFILYVDAEFARLYEQLEQSGKLENTWLILTSDHGEIFERGIMGHELPVFHQPISHIPLLIFPPGEKSRVDVYEKTSAIDLLPTLLQITGQEIPDWVEGVVIPPFSNSLPQAGHDITSIQVQKLDDDGFVAKAAAMIIRGDYKLMWYFGFRQLEQGTEQIELYDIANDPEELHNLFPSRQAIVDELLNILKSKLDDLNQSYRQ